MRYFVELCQPGDSPAMAQLHGHAFHTGWPETTFDDFIRQDNTLCWKAVNPSEGSIAGFIILQLCPPEAEIITLVVNQARQRQGIGQTLLGHIMSWLEDQGYDAVFLEVDVSNEAALTLYQRAGFVITGRRKGYSRTQDGRYNDAHIMRYSRI
jgi:ribosomal-protein-alanine N-acetyltransferase